VQSGGNSRGAWGDYDNDGYLDLFVADGRTKQFSLPQQR
jgi:hypothetical protein